MSKSYPKSYGQMSVVSVIGGTGQIGTELVNSLVNNPIVTEIRLFGRNHITDERFVGNAKIQEHIYPTFDENILSSDEIIRALKGSDAVVSTLGIGKPEDSTCDEMERVEYDMVRKFFESAYKAGVRTASVLSAVNADSSTSVWIQTTLPASGFFANLKGRLEDAIEALGFPIFLTFRPAGISDNLNSSLVGGKLLEYMSPALFGAWTTMTKAQAGQAICSITQRAIEGKPVSTNAEGTSKSKRIYCADTMIETANIVLTGSLFPNISVMSQVASESD